MRLDLFRRLACLTAVLLLPAAALAQDKETFGSTTWWVPENASTYGGEIDRLFNGILVLTVVVNIAVFAVMLVFMVKYRHKPGRHARFIHGNNKLETVWTLVPTLILALIAVFSQTTWSKIKFPDRMPAGSEVVHVEVVAQQFQWNVHYPGADGKLGGRKASLINPNGSPAEQIGLDRTGDGADDFVSFKLVVPVNRPVKIDLTSKDVIHSFFLPHHRVKQDAMPGLVGKVWFESTKTGAEVVGTVVKKEEKLRVLDEETFEYLEISNAKPFDVVCAELCGQGHYKMRGQMYVVTEEEYAAYIAAEQKNVALSAEGGEGEEGGDEGY